MDNSQFDANCQAYLEHIKADYNKWQNMSSGDKTIRDSMFEEFCASVRLVRGSKYIKVVTRNSVHSFIVTKPDAKFKFGDILKAASWAAPARNFARGNIVAGNFGNATWTGAH